VPDLVRGAREADFVVVGGGTAGCIVAARLAERGHTVVVLEAGGPYRRILDVPLVGLWAWLRRPRRYCWMPETEPQPALGGRRLVFPAGRLLGGSSSINAMVCCRGHAASYDRWNTPGWGHADLVPWLVRAEANERGASALHGADGPMGVSDSRYENPWARAFVAGCRDAGIESNDDFNGPRSDGAGIYQVFQRNGRRASTATAYLAPASRGGRVSVITHTHVVGIDIEQGRAVGVRYRHGAETSIVRASREVVVSAGTARSPQLLCLSGIGPADDLRRLRIPVVVDRANVGRGLQDHLRVPMVYEVSHHRPLAPGRLLLAGAHYVLARRGLLTSNVVDAAAIVPTNAASVIPDVRVALRWRVMPELGQFVDFEVALIDPRSRGRVALASADPDAAPAIDPAYLSEREDLETMRRGIALARRIAASAACKAAGVRREFLPAARDIDAHISAEGASAYHPVGTCRLGADEASVVDPELRVRGVAGLRVVDASVMPTTVAGNAQSAVIAIAERAADLIDRQ
jgi:choline dehydrogenase-like flavoprotein